MINKLLGKTIAIMGLGRTGLAAARELQKRGVHLLLWDDDKKKNEDAENKGFNVVNLVETDFSKIDYLIWSPGIAHTYPKPHPIAEKAKEAGVPLMTDIEFFINTYDKPKYIGITGTNGKSTVTALIHHILKTAGKDAEIGGNFGIPVFDLPALDEKGFYVLELSSYQLELAHDFNLDCAILINVTIDHLYRHKNMKLYMEAKANIFKRSGGKGKKFDIISVDDEYSKEIYENLKKTNDSVIPISTQEILRSGIYVKDGILKDAFFGETKKIMDLNKLENLKGEHNWQNIAISYAAVACYNISLDKIIEAIKSFKSLDHRMEKSGIFKDKIEFINDSKATNPDSVIKALQSFNEIYWIAGGKDNGEGLKHVKHMITPKRIKRAYMIGQTTKEFYNFTKKIVKSYKCYKLDKAIIKAFKHAFRDLKKGKVKRPIILFSPATASFDQYKNFEERGEHFKTLAKSVIIKYNKD